MLDLFRQTNYECSKLITRRYSTSFSMGILTLDKRYHDPIYAIYGFVRYADEIVDTFHDFNKRNLFDQFKSDTFQSIKDRISLNPVLDVFQDVVNRFNIDHELIHAFLNSMEMDLSENVYNKDGYQTYIYGSAEVVGLMCLKVFVDGNAERYNDLLPYARRLGAAFQKVNFLRDLKDDYQSRGRTYFPGIHFEKNFNDETKQEIEADIQADFDQALIGIRQLPNGSKSGVLLAYLLYIHLFKRLKQLPADQIMKKRARVPNPEKLALIPLAFLKTRLNLI